jgi:translocation and assembly module TamA
VPCAAGGGITVVDREFGEAIPMSPAAMPVASFSPRIAMIAMIIATLLAGGCVGAGGPGSEPAEPAETWSAGPEPEPQTGAPAYRVSFEGISDADLLGTIRASSTLLALEERPPASRAALDARIAIDRERFDAVLRSEGYYDARIAAQVDETTTPLTITVTITPGEPYHLTAYRIVLVGDAPPPTQLPLASDLGIGFGEVARAKIVVEAQARLLRELANAHRPLASVTDRTILVDHDTRTMQVTVNVDAGPPVRFGATTIEGLDRTEENYVRGLLPWQQGEPFQQDKVDRARRRLLRTGLFDAIETRVGDAVDETGELPLSIRFVEGKPRSISAGAKYSTTDGPGGDILWEHRNLAGTNDKLALKAEGNQFTQRLSGLLTRPNWRRPDQELLLGLSGTHTDSKAFNELGGEASARIRRPLAEPWTVAVGPAVEGSRIQDNTGSRSLVLFGLPTTLIRDTTADRLDPRSGTRLRWEATPYTGYFNNSVTFLQNVVTGSVYQSLDARQRIVLATRVKLGSIVGEDRESIPANKRFYAGGGDSIRGYRFQKVGPLDSDNDPIGGRSLFEFSAETRARVWGNFGVVGFVDGGTVFRSVLPSFDETMRFAAGPGLRYLTPIGPVRLDVAFPLNGRSDIDDPFEFYISLGQAF